jgi:hypothetical protein
VDIGGAWKSTDVREIANQAQECAGSEEKQIPSLRYGMTNKRTGNGKRQYGDSSLRYGMTS